MASRTWLLITLTVAQAGCTVPGSSEGERQAAATAAEQATPPGQAYVSDVPPDRRRAFFGELHVHTALSFDAWVSGTKLLPDDAYRFGRGDAVMVPAVQVARQHGLDPQGAVAARRTWPLDFMAVTDHAEELGVLAQLDVPGNALAQSDIGRRILSDPPSIMLMRVRSRLSGRPMDFPALTDPKVQKQAWEITKAAANRYNDPGRYTTFIAYEWSSSPTGKNLHRNVIFNADRAPDPFSAVDSQRPEDLWAYLERTRAGGLDALAIPHNANASDGLMFDWNDSGGRPIDEAYAQRRALNEPLTEIAQVKGQSETVPVLSPGDEFANFEVFDHQLGRLSAKSRPQGSYIRDAYGRGLVIQSRIGVNPYKLGIVGGTDIHNSLSTSDENAYGGGGFGIDPGTMMPAGDQAKRVVGQLPGVPRPDIHGEGTPARPGGQRDGQAEAGGGAHRPAAPRDPLEPFMAEIERSSGGLTGVWAEENTRNSIFAALKRKETFGTSGPRMRVRMFAGWGFDAGLTGRADWVARAYATGVAMGGDLPDRPAASSAPGFVIQAMKDPAGANLDRVQVVKVFLERGASKEKVYDVALSDGRRVDPATGKAPPIGNTVDVRTGRYENSIGAAAFTTFWRDPEFVVGQAAVYYVRVLEIPTPRWSTLVAIRNELPTPTLRPATIQERAWSSPIWYTPAR
jgi:hypothetical protein